MLLGLGVILRLHQLEVWPSPAGDEVNWTLLGLDLSQGKPAQLDSDASFVPRTFGWLIAALFWLLTPSFWSARLVVAVGVLLGALSVFIVACKKRVVLFGVVIAAFLVWHPWSLCWGRTVSVPYSLSLVLAVIGPLAWVTAANLPSHRQRTWAMIGAGQLIVLGLHFCPLGGAALAACALWLVCMRRDLLSTWAPWLAATLIVLHGVPLILQALNVARTLVEPVSGGPFWDRCSRYVLMAIDILTGEATIRHFTAATTPEGMLWIMRWACVALLFAVCSTWLRTIDTATKTQSLLSFGVLYFFVALVGLPLMLSGGRDWSLPAAHQDRYGFVLLAPWMICLAALAQRSSRGAMFVALWLSLFALLPSGRIWWAMTHGNGPDRGEPALTGGGWRGWRPVAGPDGLQAIPDALWQAVRSEAQHEPISLVLTDWYGMRAIKVPHTLAGEDRIKLVFPSRETAIPRHEPGSRVLLVVYNDGIFAANYQPTDVPAQNARVRSDFRKLFSEVRLLRTLNQADGTPLLELWDGRVPRRKR